MKLSFVLFEINEFVLECICFFFFFINEIEEEKEKNDITKTNNNRRDLILNLTSIFYIWSVMVGK